MKQEKIYLAYSIVAALRKLNHSPEVAYKLFKLNRQLKPIYDFQLEQRQELFKSIKPKSVKGTEIEFESAEDCEAFKAKQKEISELEADIEIEPIHIPFSKLNSEAKLYPDDFEILEGIIEFEEDKPEEPEIKLELVSDEPKED